MAYTANSPYYTTLIESGVLDLLNFRTFRFLSDDTLYTVEPLYEYRPDLLAYDLYDSTDLWWVFIARNPDTMIDPVFDLITGKEIYLPKANTLLQDLGS